MAEKRKRGRPSKYAPELANTICSRMAKGESLTRICDEEGMPSRESVRRWLSEHPDFRGVYAQAREAQADAYFDQSIAIADDARFDWEERQRRGEASLVCDHEHVQRSKLRVETRKWAAARMAPWKYGDKVQVEQHVTGQVQHEHKVEHTLQADADSLAEIVAVLAPHIGNGHDRGTEADEPTLQ